MRFLEFISITGYRIKEFLLYTLCGIDFYRNYSRFYWGDECKHNEWYCDRQIKKIKCIRCEKTASIKDYQDLYKPLKTTK